MKKDSHTRRAAGVAFGLLLLFVFGFALLLFRAPVPPPFGDYAEWVYHGFLLRNVLAGHPDAGYALKNYPVPNSLTTAGLGELMRVMPWQAAAKVWLIFEVALGAVCAWFLARSVGRAEAWRSCVLAAAVLVGNPFWYGFMNFLFGTYFAMLVCALLLKKVESRWIYGLLLMLAFFSHMIPFGFALVVLGLYAVQNRRPGLLVQAAPALLLTGWYLAGRAMHGNADGKAGMEALIPYGSALFVVFKGNTFLKCWGFINPLVVGDDSLLLRTLGSRIFDGLFAVNVAVACGMAAVLGGAVWRALRGTGLERQQRFFWTAVAGFFVVALFMPGAAAGISDPGGRMMQVAVWCALCVVAVRTRWTREALGLCALVLLAANLFMMRTVMQRAPEHLEFQSSMPERLRLFGHVDYLNRIQCYRAIEEEKLTLGIYPTAMFLKR